MWLFHTTQAAHSPPGFNPDRPRSSCKLTVFPVRLFSLGLTVFPMENMLPYDHGQLADYRDPVGSAG